MLIKVNKFVKASYGKEQPHLKRTLYWIRKIKPNASEELLIAACSHDINRAFSHEEDKTKNFKYGWGRKMEKHQIESGKIMFDFLIKEGYDRQKAKRVKELICRHEVGGDAEQDLLMDADSLSWLEVSVPRHIKFIEEKGLAKKELRKKIDFMYDRISSNKNKKIARLFYEKGMKMLDKVV